MKVALFLPVGLLFLSPAANAKAPKAHTARKPPAHTAKATAKTAAKAPTPPASTPPATPSGYHIVATVSQRIQATLTEAWHIPGMTPREWLVSTPELPELDSQHDVRSALLVGGTVPGVEGTELSPRHRTVLSARIPTVGRFPSTHLPVQVTYTATLYARQLTPGPSQTPVEDLSDDDRNLNLMPTPSLDWNAPSFQGWLGRNDLRRKDGETDLAFARRAFDFIRRTYHYTFDDQQDRQVSALCGTDGTDCGGLSFLFIGTLRAGGVPARALIGRSAWVGLKAQDSKKTDGPDTYGAAHVKSEFFAQGIGWVPVEMSGATSDKAAPAEAYFGRDSGHFLTFHLDPDLVYNTIYLGLITMRFEQKPAHWVHGSGTTAGMTDDLEWQVAAAPAS